MHESLSKVLSRRSLMGFSASLAAINAISAGFTVAVAGAQSPSPTISAEPDPELLVLWLRFKTLAQGLAAAQGECQRIQGESPPARLTDPNIRQSPIEEAATCNALHDRCLHALESVLATPTRSLQGWALKTSIYLYFDEEARIAWLDDDMASLAPHRSILISLRKDLLRLARLPRDFGMEVESGIDL